MKKLKIAINLAGLFIILGSNLAYLKTVDAETFQIVQQKSVISSSVKNDDEIHNIFRNMSLGLSACMVENGLVSPDQQIKSDDDTSPMIFSDLGAHLSINPDLKIKDEEDLAANITTFENATDKEMTYSTPNFSYTSTDSTTSTVTKGIGNGIDTTTNVEFPGVGSTGVTLSVHFNFSTTESQTKSSSVTWGVPSQNIVVKPHHKIRVTWILKNIIASGTADMRHRYNGFIPYQILDHNHGTRNGYALGAVVDDTSLFTNKYWNDYVKEARDRWHAVPSQAPADTADYTTSQAVYSAKYGTQMYLKVEDIDKKTSKTKMVSYRPVSNVTKNTK
jgi:hypothetical protein